ncbi:MAG: methyltransferase [Jatrophihabitantaceae bacterium]
MTSSGSVTFREADYLRLLAFGNTAFELVHTALEFELFERLEAADGMDVETVAKSIGVETQPARVLLLGLASLQLLEKRDDKYVNSPMARRRLLSEGERHLGPFIQVQADIVNQGMTDFTESMRQNTNVGLRHTEGEGTTLYERLAARPELQDLFYSNMGEVSKTVFAQIFDRFDFTTVRHVIDLGGGDGAGSVELATRFPHLMVTVFDQESVTRFLGQRSEGADLERRVRFHAGDMFTDPLPSDGDAIIYAHIFEIWSLERNVALLRKCWEALPEGGVCMVYNFVSDEDGTGPLRAGLMSPYFLTVASGEGMIYSATDIERALLAAGFSTVDRQEGMAFGHALIIGRK